jgi:hypothetical protein
LSESAADSSQPITKKKGKKNKMTTATKFTRLTKQDRCDRCSAAAALVLRIGGDGELMFCGHHFSQHCGKLKEIGAVVIGQSDEAD